MRAQRLNEVRAVVLCRDLLGLLPEFGAAFELVYDDGVEAALPAHLRPAAARTLAATLVPGGRVLQLAAGVDRLDYHRWLRSERQFEAVGARPPGEAPQHWSLWRKSL